ncbi:Vacuolar membrane-associated protein IML1, partial [Frankliniella fusca]
PRSRPHDSLRDAAPRCAPSPASAVTAPSGEAGCGSGSGPEAGSDCRHTRGYDHRVPRGPPPLLDVKE